MSLTPEQLARSGSEFGEQSALFCWINSAATRKEFPELFNSETRKPKIYANFNNAGSGSDARSNAIKGARAKQTGSQSGVADIFLPLARHGMHGLFVELKVSPERNKRKGRLSDEQKAFSRQVMADGFGWVCAEGWEMARDVIRFYLSPCKDSPCTCADSEE